MTSQLMLLIIIGIFVFMGLVGYLLEPEEEEIVVAPSHEADHDHH
jgi:hypothetical protein